MSKSIIDNVIYKKTLGNIERHEGFLKWIPVGSNQVDGQKNNINSIEINYKNIKKQQTSVHGSKACLLKVSTNDKNDIIFMFQGESKEEKRDLIKNDISIYLQKLKKRSTSTTTSPTPSKHQKQSMSDEIAFKYIQRLIQRFPSLQETYDHLVGSGIISNIEFLESQDDIYIQEITGTNIRIHDMLDKDNDKQINNNNDTQNVGLASTLSSNYLSNLINDAIVHGKKLSMNLTNNIIQEIFVDYPLVEQSYQLMVPIKMTKDVFWKNFIKSQYLYQLKVRSIDSSNRAKFERLIIDQNLQHFIDITQGPYEEYERKKLKEKKVAIDPNLNIEKEPVHPYEEGIINLNRSENEADSETNQNNNQPTKERDIHDFDHYNEFEVRKEMTRKQNQEFMKKLNRHGSLLLEFNIQTPKQKEKVNTHRSEIVRKVFEESTLLQDLKKRKEHSIYVEDHQDIVPSIRPIEEDEQLRIRYRSFENQVNNFQLLKNYKNTWNLPKVAYKTKHEITKHKYHLSSFNPSQFDKLRRNIIDIKEKNQTQLYEVEQWLKHYWKNVLLENDDGKLEKIASKLKDSIRFIDHMKLEYGDEGKIIASIYQEALKKAIKMHEIRSG